MDSRVEIRHLRAFVAVVEAGSFSAGARSLNVSQPALSQNIGMLEQSLDMHLLDRGPGGVSPTPAGAVLLSEARSLIRRFEKALAVMASFSPEASAVLHIAVPPEVTVQPLADALSKLAASPFRNTAVQISQLSCPTQLAALKKGALDSSRIFVNGFVHRSSFLACFAQKPSRSLSPSATIALYAAIPAMLAVFWSSAGGGKTRVS